MMRKLGRRSQLFWEDQMARWRLSSQGFWKQKWWECKGLDALCKDQETNPPDRADFLGEHPKVDPSQFNWRHSSDFQVGPTLDKFDDTLKGVQS